MMEVLTDATFEEKVLKSDKLAVVEFFRRMVRTVQDGKPYHP